MFKKYDEYDNLYYRILVENHSWILNKYDLSMQNISNINLSIKVPTHIFYLLFTIFRIKIILPTIENSND